MHASDVSAVWRESDSVATKPGWRLVDALISLRRVFARTMPRRAGRTAPLLPALLLVALLAAGLISLAWRSLHSYDNFLAREGGFSFGEYRTVFSDPQFHVVLERTLMMALITAAIAVLAGVAYAMTMLRVRRRGLRLALLIALFVPLLTGDITRTYGLLVMIGPGGPLLWLTGKLGLGSPAVLGTLWPIGMGMIQVLMPVAVVVLMPALLRLDPELAMAAATMGAPPRVVFLRVTLPQLRSAIVAALAGTFALGMASFADPAVLGRGLKNFVSNYLEAHYLTLGSPPQGAAIGIILLAIVSLGSAVILLLGRLGTARSR